ncbi:MAG TPA: right-handed parallel beta-helix repeat-containing protein [Solirubrobacterales bacterium]|jgi:hypothetical protein
MRPRSLRALLGAIVASALALAGASSAHAAIECGDVIKKDVKLKKHLNCTSSGTNGLIIGRDGVTIDLNGKTLRGPSGSQIGIENSGYDGVTVKNGKLRGWSDAIDFHSPARTTLRKLEIRLDGTNSDTGIELEYAVRPVIRNVTIDNAAYGLYLYETYAQKVRNVKITGNDPATTYAVYGGYLHGVLDKVRAHRASYGFYVYGDSPKLLIKNSAANKAGYIGFYLSNSTPLANYRYTLKNNTANDAGDYGFYASYDVDGGGNKAKGAGTKNCENVPCKRK